MDEMGDETEAGFDVRRLNPLAAIAILMFAALVALAINQFAPWASKQDMDAALRLRDQIVEEMRKRLDADDSKFESINAKLETINTNNGDIRETLGQIRQRLDDMQDPAVPYIPKAKHK